MKEPRDIRKFNQSELNAELMEIGQPAFRSRQIDEWLWKKAAHSFDDMTNLSKELRLWLKENFTINAIEADIVQKSTDGTIKVGFKLHDGRLVEGVMIPSEKRMTACVSSQVGCTLNCTFCATGKLTRERDLEAGEIYDQVVKLNELALADFNKPLSNIVYMGMGEPLLNYEKVMHSIEKITSPDGLGMSPKRITVSTVGIVKGIKRLADEGKKFNLALSLHAATDVKRNRIMAINRHNPLNELVDAMNYFYSKTGNKITFEYILFRNFNDSEKDASDLVQLCKRVPAFVNVIEFNPVEGVSMAKAKRESRESFVKILADNGISAKVRMSRGKDIDAACGQLANKNA